MKTCGLYHRSIVVQCHASNDRGSLLFYYPDGFVRARTSTVNGTGKLLGSGRIPRKVGVTSASRSILASGVRVALNNTENSIFLASQHRTHFDKLRKWFFWKFGKRDILKNSEIWIIAFVARIPLMQLYACSTAHSIDRMNGTRFTYYRSRLAGKVPITLTWSRTQWCNRIRRFIVSKGRRHQICIRARSEQSRLEQLPFFSLDFSRHVAVAAHRK